MTYPNCRSARAAIDPHSRICASKFNRPAKQRDEEREQWQHNANSASRRDEYDEWFLAIDTCAKYSRLRQCTGDTGECVATRHSASVTCDRHRYAYRRYANRATRFDRSYQVADSSDNSVEWDPDNDHSHTPTTTTTGIECV